MLDEFTHIYITYFIYVYSTLTAYVLYRPQRYTCFVRGFVKGFVKGFCGDRQKGDACF